MNCILKLSAYHFEKKIIKHQIFPSLSSTLKVTNHRLSEWVESQLGFQTSSLWMMVKGLDSLQG